MKRQIVNLLQVLNKNSGGQLLDNNCRAYVDKIIEKATIIKIIKENELLAFIAYYNNDIKNRQAYLTMLAVKPQSQKKGYGRRLLKKAISNLKENGFKYFELEVLKSNINVIKFYENHGFQIVELRGSKYYMKKIF